MDIILTNDYQYIDLGLPSGTLWATCNVGAKRPTDGGYFLAFGETTEKDSYSTLEHALRDKRFEGTAPLEFDSVHLLMGGDWELPTKEQLEELLCSVKLYRKDSGYEVYESLYNDAKITIPFTGYMDSNRVEEKHSHIYLWSKTAVGKEFWSAYFARNGQQGGSYYYGAYGHCMRGVINRKK